MRVKELVAFIKEREAIRVRKEAGKPRPWTKDPILGKYRFCNVHREDDSVSRWLRSNWYPTFADDPDIWFAAVVARLLNLPASLDNVMGTVLPWNPKAFRRILHERKKLGFNNFNAAYIVSTNGVTEEKVEYITSYILNLLWKDRKRLRPSVNDTLESYHTLLMSYNGLGSFIAAQIVADLKYIDECPLRYATDWWTFAASGPGSRRGLNRVMKSEASPNYPERLWRHELSDLLPRVNGALGKLGFLHAQDLQNCLCEFDKYERARLGEGTPKQIYKEKK